MLYVRLGWHLLAYRKLAELARTPANYVNDRTKLVVVNGRVLLTDWNTIVAMR